MSLFDTGVRPAIDNYLLEESKKERDYGQYWSASSAGYCMRKNIFERLGVPHSTPDDPRKQRVFSSGHIFHDWIQGLTKAAGLSIASEVELQDEDLMIRGHFDDLILIKGTAALQPGQLVDVKDVENPVEIFDQQRLILYDYKTVNSRSFLWAKKNGNAMSYYHKMQLGTYMYMLRKWLSPEDTDLPIDVDSWSDDKMGQYAHMLESLTEARILKIEKDTLMMMEQQLLWSPELESEVFNYWNELNAYWNNKKLPACTCADQEGGFMAKDRFNPFFYDGEPCSVKYYERWKASHANV